MGLHALDPSLRVPTAELSFQISQCQCRSWHRRQWASLTVSGTKPGRVVCLEFADALLEVRQVRPRPLVSNATHLGRCLEGPRCLQGRIHEPMGSPLSRNAKVTTHLTAVSVGYQSPREPKRAASRSTRSRKEDVGSFIIAQSSCVKKISGSVRPCFRVGSSVGSW